MNICTSVAVVAERCSAGKLPSLAKEGWPRRQENAAKPPLKERPGWFVQPPIIGGFNVPPRLRPLRKLRDIFFKGASTPPLPRRGVSPHCNVRQQPIQIAPAQLMERER